MTDSRPAAQSRSTLSAIVVPVVVLVVGLAITLSVFLGRLHDEHRAADARFAAAAVQARDNLRDALHRYGVALSAAASFVATNPAVTSDEFTAFVRGLHLPESFTGLQAISVISAVPSQGLVAFIGQQQRHGQPEFDVPDPSPDGDHYIITMTSNPDGHVGVDLGRSPVPRATFDAAAASGQTTMSPEFVLTADQKLDPSQVKPAFALYTPIYRTDGPLGTEAERRAALIGWTGSAFRAPDLLAALGVGQSSPEVGYELFDGATPAAGRLGATSIEATARLADHEGRSKTETLDIFGRSMALRVVSLPGFATSDGGNLVLVVFGVTATVAAAALAALLMRERRRLSARVIAALDDLSLAEHRFTSAFEHAPTGITLTDVHGACLDANRTMAELLGRNVEEVRRLRLPDVTHPDDVGELVTTLLELGSGTRDADRRERRLVRPDGSVVWTSWSASTVRDAAGVVTSLIVNVEDISVRRAAAAALTESEYHYRLLADHSSDVIGLFDENLTLNYLSPAVKTVLGYEPDSVTGMLWTTALHPDDLKMLERAVRPGAAGPASGELRMRWVRADGTWISMETSFQRTTGLQGQTVYICASRDVTARLEAEKEARASQARMAAMIEKGSDYILLVGVDGAVRYASPATKAAFGDELPNFLSARAALLVHPEDRAAVAAALGTLLADGSSHAPIEVRLRNVRGQYRTIEAAFSNLLMDEDVQAVVINGHDVTERVAAASEDVFKALHDSLTGLPNRPLMLDRAGVALHRAERLQQQVALLCVDVDHFRLVVDAHGQPGANFVLAEVARRIVNATRASDTVARTGTDKFVVVAEGVTRADVSTIAGRIRTAMNEPILLPDASLARIDVSLGIALAGWGEPAPLARDAETALQTAKRQGRGRAVVFEQRPRRDGGPARPGRTKDGRILSDARTW